MAFYSLNEEKKQHLNLSDFARSIMEHDQVLFGDRHPAGIINTIFYHFKDDADASISIALEKHRDELLRTLKSPDASYKASVSEDAIEAIVDVLADKYKDSLIAKARSYENGTGLKFRVNNANYEYLTSEDLCHEALYYNGHIGKYIKAMIEEYARLPFVKRELIYFNEFIETIDLAIEKKRKINIKLRNGSAYNMRPYKIVADKQNSYNYLVAVSEEGQAWSYRISNLEQVKLLKSQRASFSKSEREELDLAIQQKGVQFLGSEAETIIVRLSEAGRKKYKNLLFLRPPYIKIENGNDYYFNCTAMQIEFYFFKFGHDAEVLEPASLKQRFRELYIEAAKVYSSENM